MLYTMHHIYKYVCGGASANTEAHAGQDTTTASSANWAHLALAEPEEASAEPQQKKRRMRGKTRPPHSVLRIAAHRRIR